MATNQNQYQRTSLSQESQDRLLKSLLNDLLSLPPLSHLFLSLLQSKTNTRETPYHKKAKPIVGSASQKNQSNSQENLQIVNCTWLYSKAFANTSGYVF
ncbi:hypothetical protein YC2023_002155 [Brassica napus]